MNDLKKTSEAEISKPLYGMFTDVPPRYDLINHLITWRMDSIWRKKAAQACLSARPQKMLDLCCGTGDLAVTAARLADYTPDIKGLDYSQPMLDIAVRKAATAGKPITFFQGDAARLPFSRAEFDCVGISFAFRNLTYKNSLMESHMSEILRVLQPGGRFVIVESSQPKNRLVRAFFHIYMRLYVTNIGAWVSGNRPAYRYLAESVCQYFSPSEMQKFLISHGFRTVEYKPLFLGSAGVYTAVK
ncbi:MAG TPA: ubiquinone/menaquinone biosynthesis methyltransferase [Dehalococcoidales bacterium]|nr:ubiquinone/menaquinone biosynthesis methyltransferase [Dehalococcoidales bacterium]